MCSTLPSAIRRVLVIAMLLLVQAANSSAQEAPLPAELAPFDTGNFDLEDLYRASRKDLRTHQTPSSLSGFGVSASYRLKVPRDLSPVELDQVTNTANEIQRLRERLKKECPNCIEVSPTPTNPFAPWVTSSCPKCEKCPGEKAVILEP